MPRIVKRSASEAVESGPSRRSAPSLELPRTRSRMRATQRPAPLWLESGDPLKPHAVAVMTPRHARDSTVSESNWGKRGGALTATLRPEGGSGVSHSSGPRSDDLTLVP
jgi:hypothetical protein